jgi:peptidoglycan/LPS O-acetylase OafA/YrhL
VTKPNWSLLSLMRFMLAMVVVFCHTRLFISPSGLLTAIGEAFNGFAAVFGFLMISGFSIAHSIAKAPEGFYARRLERLAPTYYLCFLFCMGIYGAYYSYVTPENGPLLDLPDDVKRWGATVLMLGGIVAAPLPIMAPAWSLGAEICYYGVAPFLRKASTGILLCLGAASMLLYVVTGTLCGNSFSMWPGLVTVSCLFWAWLCGWLIYHHREHVLTWPGLVLIMVVFGAASEQTSNTNPMAIGAAGAALIAGHKIVIQPRWKRIFDYLGDLSFPLYLCHYPGMLLANLFIIKGLLPQNTPLIISVTFASAAAITGLVQWRARWIQQPARTQEWVSSAHLSVQR